MAQGQASGRHPKNAVCLNAKLHVAYKYNILVM